MKYGRFIVAATRSGSGKTTLTMGIIAALKARGLIVQPFKTGPDYLDPGFHSQAADRKCRNLDTRLMSQNTVIELFARNAADADLSCIEGVMGFFDGAGAHDFRGSTSHLAKVLRAPVILVMDGKAVGASAGAMAYGFLKFERKSRIAGFLLNNVSGARHYDLLKTVIEKRTGLPVLGYLPADHDLTLPERHLGLEPAWERNNLDSFIGRLEDTVRQYIDLDRLVSIAGAAEALPDFTKTIFDAPPARKKVRIALAMDAAFHFYYQDNLDILEHLGADLVEFSPLKDTRLPDATRGVYLGGGYPELFAKELSTNGALRSELLKKAESGLPILAECGGLMYMVERLTTFEGQTYPMVGFLAGHVKMEKGLKALGYYAAELLEDTILGKKGQKAVGHVFHYSDLTDVPAKSHRAYKIVKSGRSMSDGLCRRNVIAGYMHFHFASKLSWVKNFINACRRWPEDRPAKD